MLPDAPSCCRSMWLTFSGFNIRGIGAGEVSDVVDDGSTGGGRRLNAVWKHAIVAVFLLNIWDGFNCENMDGETYAVNSDPVYSKQGTRRSRWGRTRRVCEFRGIESSAIFATFRGGVPVV
jgi:hypothetical protein